MKTYILGKSYVGTKLPEAGDLIKDYSYKKFIILSISNNGIFAETENNEKIQFGLHTNQLFNHQVFRIISTGYTIYGGHKIYRYKKLVPKNFEDIIPNNESLMNQYSPTESFSYYFGNPKTLFNRPKSKCLYIKFLKFVKQKPRTKLELIKKLNGLYDCYFNRLSTLLLIDGYYYNGKKYYVPGPALEEYCNKYNLTL